MKPNKEKAEKLLTKGDELLQKGKFKRALRKFKKAQKYDPERADIYDRLVKAHEAATKDWDVEDVVESVGWVMEQQELQDPSFKMLHAKLSPEWNNVTERIKTLIVCEDEKEECRIVEEIRAFGEEAIYPLLHTLLQIKKGSKD